MLASGWSGFKDMDKSRVGTQTSLAGRLLAVVRRHYGALLQRTAYRHPVKAYLLKTTVTDLGRD